MSTKDRSVEVSQIVLTCFKSIMKQLSPFPVLSIVLILVTIRSINPILALLAGTKLIIVCFCNYHNVFYLPM